MAFYKYFKYIERKSYKLHYRVFLSRFRGYTTCDECGGSRLRKEVLNVRVGGKNIRELVNMTIEDANRFFRDIALSKYERACCQTHFGRNPETPSLYRWNRTWLYHP